MAGSAAGTDPEVAADVTGRELDPAVRRQLATLPDRAAIAVARHLVAAARALPDAELAHRHAVAARKRAPRIAVVREACGETAYAAGRFAEALAELKAARRLGGEPLYLPLMADCERGLGRPERALALARDPAVQALDEAGRMEMRIVEAGARRDLGEVAAAVALLDVPELHARTRAAWSPRLRYAYADALLAAGHRARAREWFERAAAVDPAETTDALDRIAELAEVEENPQPPRS